jgi:molybdenum cofactor cytidylyltransferase
MKALGVIILGAGASSRMGRPKLLLPWHNTTIIGHLIAQWRELAAAQIAVVLRPGDADLAAELDRLKFSQQDRIANPHPEHGMFSSILCAARWPGWRGDILRWAIVLGDQPLVKAETLNQLLNFSSLNSDAICQPVCHGRTAHPVILPWTAFEALKTSPAETLKDFLKQTACRSVQPVMNDPGLTLDLDTPEDYIKAKASINVL